MSKAQTGNVEISEAIDRIGPGPKIVVTGDSRTGIFWCGLEGDPSGPLTLDSVELEMFGLAMLKAYHRLLVVRGETKQLKHTFRRVGKLLIDMLASIEKTL
ncbi:MAG: hypothetical protein Q8Q14_10010 [Gemmatimonadales bacterium]|nr:hypothetical protein [Gemmatimonadales bacterium]